MARAVSMYGNSYIDTKLYCQEAESSITLDQQRTDDTQKFQLNMVRLEKNLQITLSSGTRIPVPLDPTIASVAISHISSGIVEKSNYKFLWQI